MGNWLFIDDFEKELFSPSGGSMEELFTAAFLDLAGREQMPRDAFAKFITLLSDQRVQRLENSSYIVNLFLLLFDRLTPAQRERLRILLADTYGKFADFNSRFIMTEIIGMHYADAWALETLTRFSRGRAPTDRELVPYGLRLMCSHASDAKIRAKSKFALEQLLRHSDAALRQEACAEYAKVEAAEE